MNDRSSQKDKKSDMPLPEPAGFRVRYRSEPGMVGHYPWTYADQGRRRTERPSTETENLYTEAQVLALLDAAIAAERRWQHVVRCVRMDNFGGYVIHPDDPADFNGIVAERFVREVDAARASRKEST